VHLGGDLDQLQSKVFPERAKELSVAFGLPAHHELPGESLSSVAISFGLEPGAVWPMPDVGITNAIYALGEKLVLRVPRAAPAFERTLAHEAVVVPLAVTAGMRTPPLLRYDRTRLLLPAPYVVYERVDGRRLERAPGVISSSPGPWRELGQDLRRLHDLEVPAGLDLDPPLPMATPEDLLGDRLAEGWVSSWDHDWLSDWLTALGTYVDGQEKTLVHGDIQAANVLVDEVGDYLALIDWGDARIDDPAHDFAGVPMGVVPAMLEGYGGEPTLAFKARVVRRHLQLALLLMPRGAVTDLSWAERGAPILVELMRFFASGPPAGWSDLVPPGPR
jgi:Phosphotransferase enzyme family